MVLVITGGLGGPDREAVADVDILGIGDGGRAKDGLDGLGASDVGKLAGAEGPGTVACRGCVLEGDHRGVDVLETKAKTVDGGSGPFVRNRFGGQGIVAWIVGDVGGGGAVFA